MQNFTYITIAAALMSLASCNEVEVIEPITDPQIVTRDIDIRIEFDEQNQQVVDLDIDGNGQTDFLFFANSISSTSWGSLSMVGIMTAREGNQSIASSAGRDNLCQMDLPMSPGRTLRSTEHISSTDIWTDDAMLYGRTLMNNGCEEHTKYIDYSVDRYVGIHFESEGQMIYGWIKLVAVDTFNGHYPESADVWKITQFGYNETVESTLRIPA